MATVQLQRDEIGRLVEVFRQTDREYGLYEFYNHVLMQKTNQYQRKTSSEPFLSYAPQLGFLRNLIDDDNHEAIPRVTRSRALERVRETHPEIEDGTEAQKALLDANQQQLPENISHSTNPSSDIADVSVSVDGNAGWGREANRVEYVIPDFSVFLNPVNTGAPNSRRCLVLIAEIKPEEEPRLFYTKASQQKKKAINRKAGTYIDDTAVKKVFKQARKQAAFAFLEFPTQKRIWAITFLGLQWKAYRFERPAGFRLPSRKLSDDAPELEQLRVTQKTQVLPLLVKEGKYHPHFSRCFTYAVDQCTIDF